jgi:hypothetical protein
VWHERDAKSGHPPAHWLGVSSRCRFCCPPPQVASHSVQSDHSGHSSGADVVGAAVVGTTVVVAPGVVVPPGQRCRRRKGSSNIEVVVKVVVVVGVGVVVVVVVVFGDGVVDGQTSTIQKPTSMRVGHASPPFAGDVRTARVRCRLLAPHVAAHGDHSIQSSTPQSCGQGCSGVGFGVGQAASKQCDTSSEGGQGSPSCSGGVNTVRQRIVSPYPHVTEQGFHSTQSSISQSIGQGC